MRSEDHPLEARQISSGYYYFASPTFCVSTVCMCTGSRIYYLNKDSQSRGLHCCDPPEGYIGTWLHQLAGFLLPHCQRRRS
ncbi:hypothetical protein GCG54_00004974 [Colletotrichum gloeosporioides]|uniref:Uncharacterized protein n=1 Tax=Colletotrichum gloeosporioides TaxID=474922 RepID=A0A8H4FK21_COLGL|nr:uncharacterized protein GCG54_00004974 [Colletotrichum gloeosporioides]KAF3803794.1 hypothetical protein GCG54_00004974 [Colletotrichum gloeosporioides]